MDQEQLKALYERYRESARLSPKHNMRAFWNNYVAHALAFAIGVEDSPPPAETYTRLNGYYSGSRLVASQQLVDSFIAHASAFISEHSEGEEVAAAELTLEDLGVPSEVSTKLSRQGITSLEDVYANDLDLTDRQFGMLTDALLDGLRRVQDQPASPDEGTEDSEGGEGDEPTADDESGPEGEADQGDEAPSEEETGE